MFFPLSKIFWFLFAPSHVLLWLVLATAIALVAGYAKTGRVLAVTAAVLFVLMGLLPAGVWILRPLENRYARPVWPAHVDGILILNGGLRTDILRSRHVGASEETEARIVSGFELARRYPNARVILSGGSGDLFDSSYKETEAGAAIFRQIGLDPKRLVLEAASRNTRENIAFSRRLAMPHPGDVWILATSAWHLPRAMLVANRMGWKLVPWPTDYRTATDGWKTYSVPQNLEACDTGVHEWIGLLAYSFTG